MKLYEFEAQLNNKLISIENPRPFVCDGNPLESRIFIVGFNAATEMKAQFWDFWSVETGFNKEKWFDAYVQERALKPLKPGKTRRNKVSNTRQRIEWILSEITDFKCLETNLYMTATTEAKELNKNLMDASVFNFLLESIKPKFLLIHGADAKTHMELLTNIELKLGEFNTASINGARVIIYPVSHLSRGWSKQKCFDLGKALQIEASGE